MVKIFPDDRVEWSCLRLKSRVAVRRHRILERSLEKQVMRPTLSGMGYPISRFNAFPSSPLLRLAAAEHGYKILMTNHADHRDAKYW